jgi:hypothetical protein
MAKKNIQGHTHVKARSAAPKSTLAYQPLVDFLGGTGLRVHFAPAMVTTSPAPIFFEAVQGPFEDLEGGTASRLHALGIYSVEQLAGAAAAAGPELERYLGMSSLDEQLMSRLPAAAKLPRAALEKMDNYSYPLGVPVNAMAPPDTINPFAVSVPILAPTPSAAGVASTKGAPAAHARGGPPGAAAATDQPQVNHIPQLPAIKDQQNRGTCVAFASVAVFEHFLIVNGAAHGLSEQFLYFDCKRIDGHPNAEGTWVSFAFQCLSQDGVCLASTWPYDGNPVPGNEGQGPPPARALAEALSYRARNATRIAPNAVDDIKTVLASGRCVAFSVPVYNSWYQSAQVKYDGNITMPVPGEARVGGHAMCLCGYLDDPTVGLGGGRFLVRNSWDGNWGIHCPYGTGYGTIPYAYIARYGTEAYTLG